MMIRMSMLKCYHSYQFVITMDHVVIFIPKNIKKDFSGYLQGVYDSENKCRTFYILGFSKEYDNVAFIGENDEKVKERNVVFIDESVTKVYIDGVLFPVEKCHIIEYDPEKLKESHFLKKDPKGDLFERLVYLLRPKKDSEVKKNFFVDSLLLFFNFVIFMTEKFSSVVKLFSVGLHLKERTKNLIWLLESYRDGKKSLFRGNYLMSVFFDVPLGFAVTMLLSRWGSDQIFTYIASASEELIESMNVTISWIMGSPGGLKLNAPLNLILGTFYSYLMYLWWIFLGIIRPFLEFTFPLFLKIGFLGCSFQIALLSDIFSLVSFHLYGIYVYAAKLFGFQLKQLISLSAIFFGRKRNPEPGKVDSYPYNNQQLFVATVCFTVLFFLLPTTFVYYIIFAILRLGIVMIGGILTRARYLLEILPIYCTFVWLFKPEKVIKTIVLVPLGGLSRNGSPTLSAQVEPASWLETSKNSIPEIISPPKPILWKEIGKSLLNGSIIYQI